MDAAKIFVLAVEVVVLSIVIIGSLWVQVLEFRDFNFGVCPRCEGYYEAAFMDSQGGRGYKCKNCGKTIWVSYNWVDKYYVFKEE